MGGVQPQPQGIDDLHHLVVNFEDDAVALPHRADTPETGPILYQGAPPASPVPRQAP